MKKEEFIEKVVKSLDWQSIEDPRRWNAQERFNAVTPFITYSVDRRGEEWVPQITGVKILGRVETKELAIELVEADYRNKVEQICNF